MTVPKGGEGATSVAGMAVGETRVARLAADRTSTSGSFGDVEGLAFTIDADAEYLIECFLHFRSGSVLNGLGLALNGPASPTAVALWTLIATGLTTMLAGAARAYDSGTAAGLIDTADADSPAALTGLLRNGANAGTLALRYKSATALLSVTIRAGSWARITRTL
jgi:hypothetical protein